MAQTKSKTYTKAFKKEISERIGKITSKDHFKELFKIVFDHGASYTKVPGKGVYMDIDKYDNILLSKIEDYLDDHYPKSISRHISEGLSIYYSEDSDMSSMKLTNQERNILRQVTENEKYVHSASDKKCDRKSIIRDFS